MPENQGSKVDRSQELLYMLDDPTKQKDNRLNLSSKTAIINYLDFADEIKRCLPAGRVLDWGSGSGQMSWLLDRRGLEIISYDVSDKRLQKFVQPHIPFQLAPDGLNLPFDDNTFDAVLSCGVLEHVPDDRASLLEIHRVLKPAGHLFIYQLPQVYAYTELINRMRGLWYHKIRYTLKGATALFAETGFAVETARRANLFPKNLTGLPPRVRAAYNRFSPYTVAAEAVLLKLPLVNNLGHSLEFVLRKQ